MAVEFRFGRFTLDCTRRELRRDGQRIQLEPTGFRILEHLVQHRDRAVSRPELMAAVWPDVHVSASSLYTAIYQLRNALRAADPDAAPIETLRGYGFLFTEAVEVFESSSVASEPASLERDRQLLEVYGALASEGLWCFEMDRPLRVSLSDAALVDEILQHARMSFCNAALAAMYGYTDPSELIGRPITDFLVTDRPENLAYLRSLKRSWSVRGALSFEVDRRGSPRWISNDVECVVQGDEVLRVCGMQRDVTASHVPRSPRRTERERDYRRPDLASALLEIQRLSREALASLARAETSDVACMSLSEARQRAGELLKILS